ncbi:CCS [Mytilus edulis]|uniref:CCS n=1 Tax=Mytilus edulis TaxID=6550 RepID=A0A8S3QDT0_MYTED|nr:CCS [Mytilus edulis]
METAHCLPIPKGKPNLGAAVALMDTGLDSKVKGVVRFVQVDDSTCVVDGTLDGLLPGKYGVYLHEFGDISAGCNSCGDILGKSLNKPVGEIGEITSTSGEAEFRVTNNNFKVWDIIDLVCYMTRHSQQTIGKNRQKDLCKVWDIIGRSCVLHDQAQSTDDRHSQQTIGKNRQKDLCKVWDIIGRSLCYMTRHSQQTIGKNRQKDLCKVWDIISRSCVLHDQAQSTDNRHSQQTIGKNRQKDLCKVWDIIGRSCVLHDQAQSTDDRHSQQTIGKNRQKDLCKVWDIIGRSCVLHDQAQSTDNRLLCGIVARSAGLFQNTKRICACDGVPVWDERDTPVAGPSRKSKI